MERRKRHARIRRSASSLAILASTLVGYYHADFTQVAAAATTSATDISSNVVLSQDTEERTLQLQPHIRHRHRRLRADNSSTKSTNNNKKKHHTVKLLVRYRDSHSHRRSLESFNNHNGTSSDIWQTHVSSVTTLSDYQHIDAVDIDTDAEDINSIREEMEADDDIESVEEDFDMHKTPSIIEEIIDPNDISSGHHITNRTLGEIVQHGIYQVQVDQVWDHVNSKPNKYRYTPIKVCIVDTGYDVSHEDLPNNAEGTDCGYGTPMRDGDGHGTHCAGVIGAIGGNNLGISGVNPGGQVRFHISKALNDEGMGTASSVIRGIDACINSGARIISMSLGGGPGSKLMDGMFDRAYDKNIITFAASGNVGKDMHDYPASYPHAVSIGGVDKSGKRADFSNWSNQLELMGPGKSIISCYPRNKYATLSGTSMATPMVAGVAALVWSYFPQCSNQQIRNVLASSAKTITSDPSGCSRRTGFGLVQAKNAFDMLEKYGCAAGGPNYDPQRRGGIGGCNQPLANIAKLVSLQQQQQNDVKPPPLVQQPTFECKRLLIKIVTDDYGYETSWNMERVRSGNAREIIGKGPPGESNYGDNQEYIGSLKLCEAGTFEFHMYDLFGDGMSPGHYSISMDGKQLAKSSNYGYKQTTRININSQGVPSVQVSQKTWKSLLYEGFGNGYGLFTQGGSNAMRLETKFNRNGLIMIKSGSTNNNQASIYTQRIQNKGSHTKFKIIFSFFANSAMGQDGKLCFDYQVNGSKKWIRIGCLKKGRDFETGKWFDNKQIPFQPAAGLSNNVRVRICGNSLSSQDRFFIDKVEMLGSS